MTAVSANEVPQVVIERLPQYLRALSRLLEEGTNVISSQQLGARLQVTPAQIHKDLSYFGRFGKQGRGYTIPFLVEQLRHILGLDQTWNVAVVGVGRLGRAIISYPGFAPEGFHIVCAFDTDPRLVGQRTDGLTVQRMSQMAEVFRREDVQIAIVAVPAAYAQEVVDQLVDCGIKSILCYAPVATQRPSNVHISYIDPVLALQSMNLLPEGRRQGVILPSAPAGEDEILSPDCIGTQNDNRGVLPRDSEWLTKRCHSERSEESRLSLP